MRQPGEAGRAGRADHCRRGDIGPGGHLLGIGVEHEAGVFEAESEHALMPGPQPGELGTQLEEEGVAIGHVSYHITDDET
ncbi:hypothetical protein GCM10011401_21660 [Nesterenkonia cremea]|uniref:Uncharacterized protein n=1 Tax=Nesterenkonia cremea TaxID=1882340 RepID=A0A917ATF2_9MICC|nr:hypothetical protein GCM10011401_21660 [Nesterenkonia cremea]